MVTSRALGATMIVAASIAVTGSGSAAAADWSVDRSSSSIVVRVFKKGLLSGMAHDHAFAVGEFRAVATTDGVNPTPTRFEVVMASGSLRDGVADLSPADRAKVDSQAAGEDGLDAARFPEIRFTSRTTPATWPPPGADGSAGGDVVGWLTLRGREKPLTLAVRTMPEGRALRVRGSVRFRQSEFGIEPYSGFLGMVAVEDEVQVDFNMLFVPTP